MDSPTKSAYEQLSNKHKLFVTEYVVDLNATRAAGEAGYKQPKVHSANLMAMPKIKEAIQELLAPALEKAGLEKEEVLQLLKHFLYYDPIDFCDEKTGEPHTDLRKIPKASRQLIKGWKLKKKVMRDSDGDDIGDELDLELKLVDRDKAMELVLKYLGLIKPDTTNVNVGVRLSWDQLYSETTLPIPDPVADKLREIEGPK